MKYVCTHRCQFNGIAVKGEIRELTDLEYAVPHVKASFSPLKEPAAPAAPEKPLTDEKGEPLPANAKIQTDELKSRLLSAGVRFADTASRQELFVLLQETLKPETGAN
jgi:hypothetical protein